MTLLCFYQDNDNNPITTEFGLSLYEDQQTITIQEMPERAPPGQLPRSVGLYFRFFTPPFTLQ